MSTVVWNKGLSDCLFNWDQLWEQWSLVRGGSEAQWFGALFSGMNRFIACRRIFVGGISWNVKK
jgi:hypothetical protein